MYSFPIKDKNKDAYLLFLTSPFIITIFTVIKLVNMKKLVLFSVIAAGLTLASFCSYSQVGIGTTAPDASSLLDMSSTTSGILVPRMTQAQRNAIAGPASGLLIYQIDATPGLFYNSGTPSSPNWTLAGTTTGQWLTNGTSIYYNNGNVGIGLSNPGLKLEVSESDASIHGLRIGRGGGSVSTNTAVGYLVLAKKFFGIL